MRGFFVMLKLMLDKNYDHKKYESKMYELWEKSGAFTPKIDKSKRPFTIILPPPNASGKMHTGNILMIAIEDILIRWHRMKGNPTLWVPGTDHAGFETQITFERELRKQENKSRFDFDRNTLYQKIWEFVQKNKHLIDDQIREMGASVDWSRYKFTLDPEVLELVFNTFKKMVDEGLVYRDDYVVNYCPALGTTFADLEVNYEERQDPLYFIKYGPLTVATVRPETKLGDTALAVNPKDKRYKEYIGKEIEFEDVLGKNKLKVIGDSYVDMKFGTGVLKVTPAHDKNDYAIALRHNLEVKQVIGTDGRMTTAAGKYTGLKVKAARAQVVADLEQLGAIEKVDTSYKHLVPVSYKGNADIEPLVLPNWFVKVESLKNPAKAVVERGEVKIYPAWRKNTYLRWMEEMRDWPISRQVVWGIRVPAWYNVDDNPGLQVTFLDKTGSVQSGLVVSLLILYSFTEIESGLQSLIAPKEAKFVISTTSPGDKFLQETDTFDTWFSSGHWPLACLGYPNSPDFNFFYPTDVIETAWEILRLWVSRMIMFGIYLTGKPPFNYIYLHGIVKALDGRKMSKSLGNVINPDDYIPEFGVDALRMGLVSGTANGKDFNFPRDKVIGYKKFANKLWNIARYIDSVSPTASTSEKTTDDEWIEAETAKIVQTVDKHLTKFRFAEAGEAIYHFAWHTLADVYVEKTKDRKSAALPVLRETFATTLKLLHPFMPFVTETIWQELQLDKDPLIVQHWPSA